MATKKREKRNETVDELQARVLRKAAGRVVGVQVAVANADDIVRRGVLELVDELLGEDED